MGASNNSSEWYIMRSKGHLNVLHGCSSHWCAVDNNQSCQSWEWNHLGKNKRGLRVYGGLSLTRFCIKLWKNYTSYWCHTSFHCPWQIKGIWKYQNLSKPEFSSTDELYSRIKSHLNSCLKYIKRHRKKICFRICAHFYHVDMI